MIKKFILIIITCIFFINTSLAHPLDISNSTLTIKEKTAKITTFFHSFEIDYLFKENNIEINSIDEYFENKEIISSYIKDNIILKNNNKVCNIENFTFFEEEIYNILTDGLKVEYNFNCEEKINDIYLQISFFNNFSLQTNRINIYNLNISTKSILYKVLTPKINEIEINDLENFKIEKTLDSDCDGLSDEEEKVYLTDPNKFDSDNDGYSDEEEVKGGWNPIDRNLGPGQSFREKPTKIKCDEKDKFTSTFDEENLSNLNDFNYGNSYLKNTLKYISEYFTKNSGNISYLLFLIYILGIIHAFGPGHGKGFLIAYTLEKDNGYLKGFLYALIFSITHIIDIAVLLIITHFLFKYIDVSTYIYQIQFFSILILFIFSIFILYKTFRKKEEICENKKEKTLMIAFFSGLAPCSFAWSIYLILLSLGKTNLTFLFILVLGAGIFTALITIVIISVFIKNKAIKKIPKLGAYSKYISSFIIFIISLILLLTYII